VAIVSLLVMAFAYGGTKWRSARNAMQAAAKAAAPHFVRVEDLPRAGFLRPEDLPRAAPVATRPLQPLELTPELIRKADEMLRRQEQPLGTQVVVETRDKTYIAR